MNRKLIVIGAIIAILGIGGTFVLIKSRSTNNQEVLSSQTEAPEVVETPVLEIFTGSVQIKLPESNEFIAAIDQQKVTVGSVIKTGADGRAQILYPTHSVTRIDFNSQVTVEQFTKTPSVTKVKVNDGRIWSRVAKLFGKDDSNSAETDTLVASVRGTSYGLGILTDGNNKVTVTKSTVNVVCNVDANKKTNVTIYNKLTTKCLNNLLTTGIGSDLNDEWVKFNIDQDKALDNRFGADTFNDQATPTPTASPKPTIKPTAIPTNTPAPTATVTVTASPAPRDLSISDVVTIICNSLMQNPSCDSGISLKIRVNGDAFQSGLQLYAIPSNYEGTEPDGTQADTVNVDNSSQITASFSSDKILRGTYFIKIKQGDKTLENKNAKFTTNSNSTY